MDFDRARLLAKVARLYYEQDMTQAEISGRLGLSRQRVQRLLSNARQEGIVNIAIHPVMGFFSELERSLEARFGLSEALVVETSAPDNQNTIAREIGAGAAEYMARVLKPKDKVVLSWGNSLLGMPADWEGGVYATGINNPHPEREIASLELSAGGASSKWLILAVTLSSAPVFFAPYDDLSTGIPDGWNGSVLYALFEGLAGIKDRGAAFSKTAETPRWVSAKVPAAEITLRYPASAGYCSYKYSAQEHKLTLDFTGSADTLNCRFCCRPIGKPNPPHSTAAPSPQPSDASSSRPIWFCPPSKPGYTAWKWSSPNPAIN